MAAATIDLAEAYITAWENKDLNGIAQHLHPDVHFKGPMVELTGRDAVVASTARILGILREFKVRSSFTWGDQAMFAYDFVCEPPIGVCRTAELITFEDGLVKTIELFYDARPFEQLIQKAS